MLEIGESYIVTVIPATRDKKRKIWKVSQVEMKIDETSEVTETVNAYSELTAQIVPVGQAPEDIFGCNTTIITVINTKETKCQVGNKSENVQDGYLIDTLAHGECLVLADHVEQLEKA